MQSQHPSPDLALATRDPKRSELATEFPNSNVISPLGLLTRDTKLWCCIKLHVGAVVVQARTEKDMYKC